MANEKWWSSNQGEIEFTMTTEQAESVSHSGDCVDDVMVLLKDSKIKEQLDKYTPETIKKVVDEYNDWDDEDWKEEIDNGELTIEDVNIVRLLWLAGCDISEQE